jgi:N-methylhydantoinase A
MSTGPGDDRYRVGVDVGGTFTDLLVVHEATGAFAVGKTLTTPRDPSQAIESGLLSTLARAGIDATRLRHLVHGTTLVTNAIIERKGARTALLATAGFRDALEIGREQRYELYDLGIDLPRPLVPRYLRFDVPQRTLADGGTLRELDEAFVERLAGELADRGIGAVAIAFLHAYANPGAERAARAAVLRAAPAMRVSISSEVAPEIREFERTSTTVANVYVQGLVEAYLRELQVRLARLGFQGSLFLMLSSGGVATADTAVRFPIRLLESGPAAGALAAARLGTAAGHPNLLSFDMGGTTAKFCVIEAGRPLLARQFEFDRVYRFQKGSGLPANVPVIEMIEIGAGGGSIARVDSLGLLKVGPDSAGADPGPACYGRGGTEPTVTDADLVLGYLDDRFFLGGSMPLDREAARRAIDEKVARPLGLGVEQAAWGIHEVVNQGMANAARVHVLERGQDPRSFPLLAFGGAGPVHGYRIALALGAPATIAPLGAGVMSTVGFLAAPLAFDFVRPWRSRLDDLDWPRANDLLAEMESEGRDLLLASGVAEGDLVHRREADMRYVGQGHEIRVPLPAGRLSGAQVAGLVAAFEATYRERYDRLGPPVPLEVISWRVVSAGPEPGLDLHFGGETRPNPSAARKGSRRAYFPEHEGYVETPVYDRYLLEPGAAFGGPAILEERESTAIVGPGARCTVDARWNLVITRDA